MYPAIYSALSLLISFGIICLGHGFNNTVLGIRSHIEQYPTWVIGTMMSGYYLGFIFGAKLSVYLIPRVGQVRCFAAFASIASTVALLHVLFINEISWILLRIIYGTCMSALYVIIESWLNMITVSQERGRVMSTYMAINHLGQAAGQIFIFIAPPEQFSAFAIISIMMSLSIIPLLLSKKIEPPKAMASDNFSFMELFKVSPLATFGCLLIGVTLGGFWGLATIFFLDIGMKAPQIAVMLMLSYFGGLVFQTPLGYLSDIYDRRKTMALVLIASILVCLRIIYLVNTGQSEFSTETSLLIFLFGGFCYSLYSLFIALANDYLPSKDSIKASGGLITLHAIGAILGPLFAALAMSLIGKDGLIWFICVTNSIILIITLARIARNRVIPEDTREKFLPIPRTSNTVIKNLDPRISDDVNKKQ